MVGHKRGVAAACLVVLCFGGACSSGGVSQGRGEVCEAITPCGGDPVGTWTLRSECLIGGWEQFGEDMYDEPECSDALVSVDVTPTGTLIVNADGTYETQTHVAMSMRVAFTRECIFALLARELSDAELQEFCESTQSEPTDPAEESTWDSITCSLSGDTCQCVATNSDDYGSTGTYVISGANITTTDADGEVSEKSFCIQGNQMQTETTSDGITGVAVYQRS